MGIRSLIRRHRGAAAGTALVIAALLSFGLYWFAPWNLFIDKKVQESVPTVAASPVVSDAPTPAATPGSPAPNTSGHASPTSPAGSTAPVVVAQGEFQSLEHSTSGRALILQLADGSRYLRLEDLNTSNGPDLRVWITDQPASSDWHVWDDGAYVDLGALKGNIGDQNYLIPADVDLGTYRTAVIWCRRFKVGFGVAPLEPA
jgi:hypothetical protein